MDYLFFSSLLATTLLSFVVSYDICCQWSKYLWIRMSDFPDIFHIDHLTSKFTFVVPKFHLPAHVARCQTAFSLNFTRWVGRTDGEAPERGWSDINAIAPSTKEMGPGSRRDTSMNILTTGTIRKSSLWVCLLPPYIYIELIRDHRPHLVAQNASRRPRAWRVRFCIRPVDG